MEIFEQLESEVRGYIRSFPIIFDKAVGAELFSEEGARYIDFFAGAGTLNYGHNPECSTQAVIRYLERGAIVHGLDMATVAKRDFLETFSEKILKPRGLDYKIQFTGPTGTNATESALKLAKIVKNRSNIVAFTNGYHGLTMGSLAVTGNADYRNDAYDSRGSVFHMPFEGFLGSGVDTIDIFRRYLEDNGSGLDLPAAVIMETIQGEGGIKVASAEWLRRMEKLCREFGMLLIVDDIQMGNGRSGDFFSFEDSGIVPDMVCLSKSIGGGNPMAVLMMKREYDQWQPGEHTGTFRGNNIAFVAAAELIKNYWSDDSFSREIKRKGAIIEQRFRKMAKLASPARTEVRGRGMAWGLAVYEEGFAKKLSRQCFDDGLIAETCGPSGEVLKLLPPLTISDELLTEGLDILEQAVVKCRKG